MGNTLEKNSNQLTASDLQVQWPLLSPFPTKHQTSLSHRSKIPQKASNQGLEFTENTIILNVPSEILGDAQGGLEKSLKTLINKDKLHQWKSLKQLNIIIEHLGSESLWIFLADFLITRFRDIKRLKLCFKNLNYYDTKFYAIFMKKITKFLTRLTQFELIFRYQTGIRDSSIKPIIRQIIRNLPCLELLTLCFEGCPNVTKESFDAFGYYTRRNLPNLKKLNLAFREKNIPHFKFNFDTLFPSLQSLRLNLSFCSNTSNHDLKIFASNVLSKLSTLQEMILKLRCFWNITDEGMQAFSSCISQNPNLKRLELDFYGWRGITDEGLKSFAQEVCRKNVNLKDFTVLFGDCYRLEDSGIISLADELKTRLKALEKLNLDFSKSPHQYYKIKTSDRSLKAISEVLSCHSESLKFIELSFSGCNEITNKGLKNLIKTVEKNMKNLKQVRLDFRRCPLIEKQEIEKINKKFKAYSNVDFRLQWSQDLNKK